MNTYFDDRFLICICCALTISFLSCNTNEQKPEEAFENAKKERAQFNGKTKKITELPIVKKQRVQTPVQKKDEWASYKIESERLFRLNRAKILEIRGLRNINKNVERQMKDLENDNNKLKTKMDEYMEEEKTKRDLFMVELNHKANQIGIELNTTKTELATTNQKQLEHKVPK
jgi:hypothetical protein